MGRRSAYNPVAHEKIVQGIRMGATYELAAAYAGVHADSLRRWMRKGEAGESPYTTLVKDIEHARGKAAVGWLSVIESAASKGDPKAAMWKLEHIFPQIYGRRAIDLRMVLQSTPDQELLMAAEHLQIGPEDIDE